jgi:TolB protein
VIVFGAFGGGQADLWSVAPHGSGLTNLTNTPDSVDICPAVSADGRKIASCRNAGDGFEIWSSDVGGGNDRQLTDLGGWAIFPDWNPQGNRIVFSWAPTPDDLSNLYVVHARSGKVTPLLVEDGYAHEYPVFSPDGRTVLYVKLKFDDNGDPVYGQLWTVDVKSGRTTQLTFDDTIKDQTPDWSPDGTRIAYNAITDGDDDIWIMNADGSDQQNLTEAANATEFGTSFSPDGQWIAFTGMDGPVPAGERYVQVMRTDGSQRRVLVETPGWRQAVPAWQPVSPRTR